MMQNLLQCASVLSLAAIDLSLALAWGLAITGLWLRRPRGVQSAEMRAVAAALAAALLVRFYLLSALMIQDARPAAVFGAAAEVAATHAGAVTLWALLAACVLACASWAPRQNSTVRARLLVALVATILVLHSAMGHSADNGNFTRDEFWQLVHLTGMATWSGVVMTAGFFVAPRMFAAASRVEPSYLRALSRASTWSVIAVALSGILRAWTGLDGHIALMAQTAWGRILTVKLFFVCVALALGYLHRRWIHKRREEWTPEECGKLVTTLRIEAICLAIVLMLSAWLGSVDLPGSM
jgi:copper resistance protein D